MSEFFAYLCMKKILQVKELYLVLKVLAPFLYIKILKPKKQSLYPYLTWGAFKHHLFWKYVIFNNFVLFFKKSNMRFDGDILLNMDHCQII